MAQYVDLDSSFPSRRNRTSPPTKADVDEERASSGKSSAHSPSTSSASSPTSVKPGKHTSFPQAGGTQARTQSIVFSWIIYKSRAQRDRSMREVMKDPRLAPMMDPKTIAVRRKRMF